MSIESVVAPSRAERHLSVGSGAPHDDQGVRIGRGVSGPGRAKCYCGWMSAPLDSSVYRFEAQARHRLESLSTCEQGQHYCRRIDGKWICVNCGEEKRP